MAVTLGHLCVPQGQRARGKWLYEARLKVQRWELLGEGEKL